MIMMERMNQNYHFQIKGYPIKGPPDHTMKTKMFHVNINSKGKICCALFDHEWHRFYLLKKPDPTAAVNDVALNLFVQNEKEFWKTVQEWNKQHAS